MRELSVNIFSMYHTPKTATPQKPVKIFSSYPSSKAIKNAFKDVKKFYTNYSSPPSMFQCFSLPYDFFHYNYLLIKAQKNHDKEALLDAKLKIFKASTASVYSFFSLLEIISRIGTAFSYLTFSAHHLAPSVGVLACIVTSGIAGNNLMRERVFWNRCQKTLTDLKKGESPLEATTWLKKYLPTSSSISIAPLSQLANRVEPWYAEKMVLTLPALLEKLASPDGKQDLETLTDLVILIKDAKTQAAKKMVQQGIFLVANAMLISAFVTALLGFPIVVVLSFLLMNLAILVGNYFFASGTLQHEGWSFSLQECIPSWLKERLSGMHEKGS